MVNDDIRTDGKKDVGMAAGKREVNDVIQARGIYKSFNSSGTRIEILKNVSFALSEGEKLAVVGASGIGKSTLLHILGTLDRPDKGGLIYRGQNVLDFDHKRLASFRNRSVGFVFQFHYLLPEFTALENVMMPVMISGLSKAESKSAAAEILERVGLKDRIHHRVAKLSGGEQQRVALARALVLKPVILLADEPTGNLDKGNSEQVHELLMALNQEFNMTMVVVTHNLELAALMTRKMTIIDGKLVEIN
jgi:lipoprotein-releasing system ATP-binding protein